MIVDVNEQRFLVMCLYAYGSKNSDNH